MRVNYLGEVVEDQVERKKERQQRRAGGGKELDSDTRQELGERGKGNCKSAVTGGPGGEWSEEESLDGSDTTGR